MPGRMKRMPDICVQTVDDKTINRSKRIFYINKKRNFMKLILKQVDDKTINVSPVMNNYINLQNLNQLW